MNMAEWYKSGVSNMSLTPVRPPGLAVGNIVARVALRSADTVLIRDFSASATCEYQRYDTHGVTSDKVAARGIHVIVHLDELVGAELIFCRKIVARRFPGRRVQRARQRYFLRAFNDEIDMMDVRTYLGDRETIRPCRECHLRHDEACCRKKRQR